MSTVVVLSAVLGGCGTVDREPRVPIGPGTSLAAENSARRCVPANEQGEMPTVEQVLPPGLGSSLGLWGYSGDAADTLTLSIRYGPHGDLEWVRVVGVAPDSVSTAELERLVGSAVPATGKPDWGVRLLMTAEGTPVGVRPAVVCPAVPISRLPPPGLRTTRRDMMEMASARGRRLEARVLLDDRGRIVDVELSRGSGNRLLDQNFLYMIWDTTFRPSLHDGFPVAGVTVVTYQGW